MDRLSADREALVMSALSLRSIAEGAVSGCDSPWFAGLSCDHLFADCQARSRASVTLEDWGWWDVCGSSVDPHGSDVCGLCLLRHNRLSHQKVGAA